MWPVDIACARPFLLTVNQKAALGGGLFVLGALGTAASGWLTSALLLGRALPTRPHLLLLSLSLTQLARVLLAGFPFSATSALSGRWLFGPGCCQLFAFLRQFLRLSQSAALALLSVERLLTTRGKLADGRPRLRYYWAAVLLCWAASAAWATPPLFGWGRYECDATATSCDVGWSPSGDRLRYSLPSLLLADLLPAALAVTCSWRSLRAGKSWCLHQEPASAAADQRSFCKTVAWLVASLELFHAPQILLQLMSLADASPLPLLIMIAPLCSEASTILPLLVCLGTHKKLRNTLTGRPT
ncbi:visual pigment-like receptor peropsin [Schistocerca americana]|uniref:visual pigment-like receptor peropsin n=1 Tax=Schistocerca americana TaxID=7009 RepID=UPI001F4F9ECC|nr:visual pigment-like receptor peropsin [Schistocerca americana]